MFPELGAKPGCVEVDPRVGQHEPRDEDRRLPEVRRHGPQLPEPAARVRYQGAVRLRERGGVGVSRDEDVYLSTANVPVHRGVFLCLQEGSDAVGRRACGGRGGALAGHPGGHGRDGPARRPSDREEEEDEHGQEQQRVPGDLPEHGLHARQRAVAVPEGDGLRAVGRDGDPVGDDPVERVPGEQRQQQVTRHPAEQVVEDAARHPFGDGRQRVDHADIPQVEVAADAPGRRDPAHHVRDDVVAERRVQGIVVVRYGVGRVELVAVLAVDEPPWRGPEARGVAEGELVHEPLLAQRPPDLPVPPDFRVVVARQIDDPPVATSGEGPQRGEQPPVLGARDRDGDPVLPGGHVADLQQVEEVPGQHQLHGSVSGRELFEEGRQVFGRLEVVLARVAAYVRVRQENHQRVVPQQARSGRRPAFARVPHRGLHRPSARRAPVATPRNPAKRPP